MISFTGSSWQQARREALALVRFLEDGDTYASYLQECPGIDAGDEPDSVNVMVAVGLDDAGALVVNVTETTEGALRA